MSAKELKLQIDVVRLADLPNIKGDLMLSHVLSTVWSCPGKCKETYAITVNVPVALEVEMGVEGKEHLQLLASSLESYCQEGHPATHLRTDGKTVWQVV